MPVADQLRTLQVRFIGIVARQWKDRSVATGTSAVLYREEQRFSQPWIWLIVLGIAALIWWGFLQQVVFDSPFGNNPAPNWLMWLLLVLFGIAFPIFFFLLRLITEVREDGIRLRFFPIWSRTIRFDEIETAEARSYNAVREYGGWGIKGWSKKKVAYNVRGNQGVELTLSDGRTVMIGSQHADDLAAAIAARGVTIQS